jgi:hypothetical protein
METATSNKNLDDNKEIPNAAPTPQPAADEAPQSYGFLQAVKAWVFPPDTGYQTQPRFLCEIFIFELTSPDCLFYLKRPFSGSS